MDDKHRDVDSPNANPSGAPEAGGATTPGSSFGGRSLTGSLWRAVARVARSVEAAAYRALRNLDRDAPEPSGRRGRPDRVRTAVDPPSAGQGHLQGRRTPKHRPPQPV